MIKISDKKRDITDTVWSVLTSFGYEEVENNEGLLADVKNEPGKYCYFEKNTICAINSGKLTDMAKAEALAICIESAVALGIEYFYAKVADEKITDIASLFGFDGIVEKGTQKYGFSVIKDEVEFASGKFGEVSQIFFDIDKICEALILSGEDISPISASATLIFAEKNAEGVAYETAYNLRINGCIVELFTESGTIEDAEKYAEDKGISCIIRAFADGRLMIKDFEKNEIIETSIEDFLGYYEDDEEECDCGHHHHGDNCGCH